MTNLYDRNGNLRRGPAHTLRYFRRGGERLSGAFWLPEAGTPRGRLATLTRQGYLERGTAPNADLYRITQAGLDALEA